MRLDGSLNKKKRLGKNVSRGSSSRNAYFLSVGGPPAESGMVLPCLPSAIGNAG